MSSDHVTYVPSADPSDQERGSYGGTAARVVLWVMLAAALGFFGVYAVVVDGGIWRMTMGG